MITLETGLPGSGKTLYCVDKLLRSLVGTSIERDGVQYPRTIYTNINGLLLDHVKIGPGAEWSHKGGQWVQDDGDKLGLANWHEWAKPGSVIVFDEVQKPWPLAATGAKVPPMIEALETHRHMGVDFIVLTQHPMLVHANLTRLVGRHLHVRRMGNMGLAIVYEWDSCSRTLLYKNCFAKGPYRYDKKVFDLYKSAELHTKVKRRVPALFFGVAFASAGLLFGGPYVYGRISERLNPAPKSAAVAAPKAGASAPVVMQGPVVPVLASSAPPGSFPLTVSSPPPAISGCIRTGVTCRCLDTQGQTVPTDAEVCGALTSVGRGAAVDVGADSGPIAGLTSPAADLEALRWMARNRPSERQRLLSSTGRE